MAKEEVELCLPASTSNCGPGFDTLSIGLSLYNFCRLRRRGGSYRVEGRGEQGEDLAERGRRAADLFFARIGADPFAFEIEFWGDVPVERGLGSSATVYGGILLGLNALCGDPLGPHECVRELTRLDNAPDNVCALVRGGFCVSRTDPESGEYLDSFRFPVTEDLSLVVAAPEVRVSTPLAREVLPDTLPFAEVVKSLNGLAYLVGAFAKQDYERLRGTTRDAIHQPFRKSLNPFVDEAIHAGVTAGAYAGWLSGSGSSVVCAAPRGASLEVRGAMESLYREHGIHCRMMALAVDNEGARVVESA